MKVLLVAVAIVLMASPTVFAAKGDAAAGKDTFTKRCAMCHGPDATGDTPIAKALGATIPDYRSKAVQSLSDADLKKGISEGKGKMPAQSGMSDQDLDNLVAYIRTFAKKS